MCEKRSPCNKRRDTQSSSSGSQPALVDDTSSENDVMGANSEDDAEVRRMGARPFGPTITVHTPSGPQQLITTGYTKYKVVTLRTFLKSKGLSQQGRKADLIARLIRSQEDLIKSMEDGTYAHPQHRRGLPVSDENRAASSTNRPEINYQPDIFSPLPRTHDTLVCKFGVHCKRAGCHFKHPLGRLDFPEGNTSPPPTPRGETALSIAGKEWLRTGVWP